MVETVEVRPAEYNDDMALVTIGVVDLLCDDTTYDAGDKEIILWRDAEAVAKVPQSELPIGFENAVRRSIDWGEEWEDEEIEEMYSE